MAAARAAGGRRRWHPDALARGADYGERFAEEVRVEGAEAIGGVAAHGVPGEDGPLAVEVEMRSDVVPHLEDVVLGIVAVPAVTPAR